MAKFFKYFQFTTVERNGFILLSLLVLFVNVTLFLFRSFKSEEPIEHRLYTLEENNTKIENDKESEFDFSKPDYSRRSAASRTIHYFKFNPNTIGPEEWERLGLSAKQIKVIQNYISKGGKFYKKEDLKKIYSIYEKDYDRLYPYIVIEGKANEYPKFPERTIPKTDKIANDKVLVVELNSTDTTQLKRLKGIGIVLSARIIKFRDALGGFHQLEQLKEVYGLTEETFDLIKGNLKLSNAQVRKLDVNNLNAEELAKHPYISKKQAQVIVNFRNEHGPFRDFDNFTQNKALDKDFLRKIEPYLEFK
ncbi:ComEA family DNA-binding protein [Sphingobacterium sp. SGL-16]|uniref:ComEA family DNA-binding protein n=1 Tax=Sphingobacterium sp. SGL-16 TaxID=2710883 RepID=UPI0013EB23A8|nr:helix-hairpin-helix domain-containing protein [Sphingobacterium sp. SGL-16]NGM71769.1 hypothetical protein [Sphingobacterium sp. SGL-16]